VDTIACGDFWQPVNACHRMSVSSPTFHGHCLHEPLGTDSEIGIAAGAPLSVPHWAHCTVKERASGMPGRSDFRPRRHRVLT